MGQGDAGPLREGGFRVEIVLERLARLEEYVRLLEGLRGKDFTDPYLKGALERYMQLSAEATLDAGEMIVAHAGLPKPDTYRGIIRVLTEAGVLPRDFGEGFERIASLRNILVHDYTRVDVARLAEFLDQLDDFRVFARHISSWLAARERP